MSILVKNVNGPVVLPGRLEKATMAVVIAMATQYAG